MRTYLAILTALLLAASSALCVSGAIAQDMQPGRGGGSFVETDPIATPLANAALDGVADGSGVSNAAAFRSAIGAGALCTGADAGDVPYTPATGVDWTNPDPVEAAGALDTLAGRVVALESVPGVTDAADLTYTPGSLLDWAGSADPGDVDVALDQLADRTQAIEAAGSSPYAADEWDYEWNASEGSLAAEGFALTGTGSEASGTIGGVACQTFTPAGAVATYYSKNIVTPGAGPFEVRVRTYLPASTASTTNYGWAFVSSASGANRRIFLTVTANGPQFTTTAGALTSVAIVGNLVDRWVDWTVRFMNGGGGLAYGEIWLGAALLWSGNTSSAFSTTGTPGDFTFGRIVGTAGTSVSSIASVKYRDGWNEAPPSWTFRALAGAVGP